MNRKQAFVLLGGLCCCFFLVFPTCTIWVSSGWFSQNDCKTIGVLGSCFNITSESLIGVCQELPPPLHNIGLWCFFACIFSLVLVVFSCCLVLVYLKKNTVFRVGCLPWETCVALLLVSGCIASTFGVAFFTFFAIRQGYKVMHAAVFCILAGLGQGFLFFFLVFHLM